MNKTKTVFLTTAVLLSTGVIYAAPDDKPIEWPSQQQLDQNPPVQRQEPTQVSQMEPTNYDERVKKNGESFFNVKAGIYHWNFEDDIYLGEYANAAIISLEVGAYFSPSRNGAGYASCELGFAGNYTGDGKRVKDSNFDSFYAIPFFYNLGYEFWFSEGGKVRIGLSAGATILGGDLDAWWADGRFRQVAASAGFNIGYKFPIGEHATLGLDYRYLINSHVKVFSNVEKYKSASQQFCLTIGGAW